MASQGYFPSGTLDSPATDDDLAHLADELNVTIPPDLLALWKSTATFNGNLLLADGSSGPYFRLFHPTTALTRSTSAALQDPADGVIVFGANEDWDYAVITDTPPRFADIDRESGEVLSDLGSSIPEFFDALRAEHAEQYDLLN